MQFMVTIGVAMVDGFSIDDAVRWDVISAICIGIPGTVQIQCSRVVYEKYFFAISL